MRKTMTFLAMAALATNLAAPVYAADIIGGGHFNPTTPLGWRQTHGAAAMAYFHMPFAGGRQSVPRIGLMVAGPTTYYPGESSIHLDGARVVDFSFAHGPVGRPWMSNSWTTTLTLADTVAWSNDRSGAPGTSPHLFESGLSWVAVGALTAAAVIGAFALTDRKKPGT